MFDGMMPDPPVNEPAVAPESMLLPCPFCEGEATMIGAVNDGIPYVIACCCNCPVTLGESGDVNRGHRFSTYEEAIAAWNTRTCMRGLL